MTKRKLPDWIPGTHRAWKQKKRAEWKEVERAFERFWRGSAYVPFEKDDDGTSDLYHMRVLMGRMRRKLSAKEWGR